MLQKNSFILGLFFLFSGCEQIIDLDLNETQKVLVIEGDLSTPDGVLTVVITQTGSYFETNPVQKIEGARVHLVSKNGVKTTVPEIEKGIYKLQQIHSDPGDEFKLSVEINDEVYVAESTVQLSVDIVSVSYSYYPGDSFFRPGYRFKVEFNDPPAQKNYYRIRVYKNGYLFNRPADLVVFDDTDLDGTSIDVRLHSQYYLYRGESAVIELMAIDRQAWEYFSSLGDILNAGPGSPAPANPVSSFSNGALGYFYAWSYSRKVVQID